MRSRPIVPIFRPRAWLLVAVLAATQSALAAQSYLVGDAGSHFSVEIDRVDAVWVLRLSRLKGRTATGQAIWEVVDELKLQDVLPAEEIWGLQCRTGNQWDPELIGVGVKDSTHADSHEMSRPRLVFRASRKAGKILPEDTAHVVCEEIEEGD